MRTYREDYDNTTEVKKTSALRIVGVILMIIIIAGALIGGGIWWSLADKSLDGPNGWLISGFSQLFGEKEPDFIVEVQFRPTGSDAKWGNTIIAEVGARVDVRIQYANRSPDNHNNVAVWCNLPSCLTYEEGSTILYNSSNKDGMVVSEDTIAAQGLYIGSYVGYTETGSEEKRGANAFVYFTVTVTDNGITQPGDSDITLATTVRAGPENNQQTTQTDSTIIIRK